ncbi:unnamed protein product [Arctogadus glacialis]
MFLRDKMKENFARGSAELEKRRLALEEERRRERERRDREQREAQERREREARGLENRRRLEEERRLERQREVERQREEERCEDEEGLTEELDFGRCDAEGVESMQGEEAGDVASAGAVGGVCLASWNVSAGTSGEPWGNGELSPRRRRRPGGIVHLKAPQEELEKRHAKEERVGARASEGNGRSVSAELEEGGGDQEERSSSSCRD